MDKNSKIYIAGHTGLIGSAVLEALKKRDYGNLIYKIHKELDLTNQIEVKEFFKQEQPEYVFMAAGLTGGIIANKTYPAAFFHANIAMQDNVFEAANKYAVKHLIFYGSSCVYPKNSLQPIREEYLLTGAIEETSEAYAVAKIAGIIACRSYNRQFNTKRFIALLPNSTYGPNDNFDAENSHVLAALIKKIHTAKINRQDKIVLWGSGNPKREFIFSEDVADASIFVMQNADKLQNCHYNIGTGIDYSIKELVEIISKNVGFKGRIEWDITKPDGAPKKLLDSTRFKSLGWMPAVSLEDGIRMTYGWFVEHSL